MDATGPAVDKDLPPRVYSDPLVTILNDFLVKGLSMKQALACRQKFGSKYYQTLLNEPESFDQCDRALLNNARLQAIVQEFAENIVSFRAPSRVQRGHIRNRECRKSTASYEAG